MNVKSLRALIRTKTELLDDKRKKLEKINQELDGFKRLIARNKANAREKYISFPFLVVKPSNVPNTTLDIKKQQDCLKFALFSNNEFQIFGDLEVTNMIRPSLPPLSQSSQANSRQ